MDCPVLEQIARERGKTVAQVNLLSAHCMTELAIFLECHIETIWVTKLSNLRWMRRLGILKFYLLTQLFTHSFHGAPGVH
jgi:hypothetical protein